MLKDAHIYRRIVVPFALAVLLLFAFAPATLAASHGQGPSFHLVGPKQHYLALGDSLAFGFQPNFDFTHGYVNDLFQILQNEGTKDVKNLGCPGETSTTFIKGGCPASPSTPAQLAIAVAFLQANAKHVNPVTLDIGANDVLGDITFTPTGCTLDTTNFSTQLTTLDSNLTGTILPALKAALTLNGHLTGDIVMMNYYDPFQNICPASVPLLQTLNQHLKADVSGFGIIVDVFGAFGGSGVPNQNICTYTWMCTPPPLGPNIHATDLGYSVIADTFAAAIPTD
jgi:lysophospholipase L1-like esterase